jgi:hypothetical protein
MRLMRLTETSIRVRVLESFPHGRNFVTLTRAVERTIPQIEVIEVKKENRSYDSVS